MLNTNKGNNVLLQIIFPYTTFLDKNGFDETLFQALYSLYIETKNLTKAIGCTQYEKKYVHKKQLVPFLGNY
jgi:hypothetical protein